MKLILKRIDLKQKGWFSWLYNISFVLKINSKKIKLKAGSQYLFYVLEVPTGDVNIIIDIDNVLYDYSKTFISGIHRVVVDNPSFHGSLEFELVDRNLLLHLENSCRDIPLVSLSRKLQGCNELYSARNSFENNEYYVNKESYSTSYTRSSGPNVLPLGWETRVVNKKIVYINHNFRTTYWRSPAYKLNVLREKMDTFEGLISNINFLSIRSFIPLKINVVRGHIVDSTGAFLLMNVDKLRSKKVHVIFEGEMGQDYGALLREYMYEASSEIFNDPRMKTENNYLDIGENKATAISVDRPIKETVEAQEEPIDEFTEEMKNKIHLSDDCFYIFLGVFVGMSILFNENMDFPFSLPFCENLLKRKMSLKHVQDIQYQKSILWMLRNETEEEIIPGESQDKEKFVEKILNENLLLKKKIPYDLVRKGFYSIIPEGFKDIFEADEVASILYNERVLDVNAIRDLVIYNMCKQDTVEVVYLWNILSRKDQKYLRVFLKFITGSGSIPKLINNYNFRIIIEKSNIPDMLFRASACLNKLFIGSYENEESMERIMDFSVLNTEGFHKV
ncbi:NEDD4-like E3 ubiquitin-protein ligase WWP1 [Nosema granulosis]|uniref:HECT-type E3 ubiquitin transferase n=1 Tax=Nosema granulosis TaxID=83296 RepID=A0A9P6KZW4_9MICR|nr:NEDD4-like E3 ubiquitin-protein ligase WWP1 [Nosema granulosis]